MKFWRRRKKQQTHPKGYENILPPEGVPLQFQIAGTGVRLAAQVSDIAITAIGAIAVVLFWFSTGYASPNSVSAIGSMLFFIIRIPYYVLSELLWNGQTLGKRLMKIKVISADGGSLNPHALVSRNLMKEAEIFLPGTLLFALDAANMTFSLMATAWIIAVLAVPLMNRRRQRLGDLIAGTFVIHLPVPVLLKDMALEKVAHREPSEEFTFLSHHLEHYGRFELQTLEDLLRARETQTGLAAARRRKETLAAVVEQIRRKIDYADPVTESDSEAFLSAFYNAQRSFLEQKQLFGEKRADKTHNEQQSDSTPK